MAVFALGQIGDKRAVEPLIKNLNDEFNKLVNEDYPNTLNSRIDLESILLSNDKKYISRNMSDNFEDIGQGTYDDFENILIKMHTIDFKIKNYPNFDDIITKIGTIYDDKAQLDDFYNQVTRVISTFDPVDEKDKIIAKYIKEIKSKALETIRSMVKIKQ